MGWRRMHGMHPLRRDHAMRVLVGCEYSGRMRRAFQARGHEAWSCDLLPAEDGEAARHHVGDVVAFSRASAWDLCVFHPPCTQERGTRHCALWLTFGRWIAHGWRWRTPSGASLLCGRHPHRLCSRGGSVTVSARARVGGCAGCLPLWPTGLWRGAARVCTARPSHRSGGRCAPAPLKGWRGRALNSGVDGFSPVEGCGVPVVPLAPSHTWVG